MGTRASELQVDTEESCTHVEVDVENSDNEMLSVDRKGKPGVSEPGTRRQEEHEVKSRNQQRN